MKIVIIGAGNLATHLALALQQSGEQIIQIYSRTEESASILANKLAAPFTNKINKINNESELYIYAVSDSAISDLIDLDIAPDAIHIHTAGSVSINIFNDKKRNYGVLYPLQTFSKNKEINFKDIPVFLEASSPDVLRILQNLACKISDDVQVINSETRLKLHMAAVFACNFVNYLYDVSNDIIIQTGLTFDILKPLIRETADKINYLTPYDSQTGPAKRFDRNVIDKHIQMLDNQPELKVLYEKLSQMIFNKHFHQP